MGVDMTMNDIKNKRGGYRKIPVIPIRDHIVRESELLR